MMTPLPRGTPQKQTAGMLRAMRVCCLILLAGTAFGADGLYSNRTIVSMDAQRRMFDRP